MREHYFLKSMEKGWITNTGFQADVFDFICFDEASQMHPEEAIGLIARCKQIIIVGDQKQLPPDNRWKSNLDDEDDAYDDDEDAACVERAVVIVMAMMTITARMAMMVVAAMMTVMLMIAIIDLVVIRR